MFIRLVLLLSLLLGPGTAGALSPLEPLDTSSPRATVKSFLAVTDDVDHRFNKYRDSPSPATEEALIQALERAVGLLDLSQLPPATQRQRSAETFFLLWEVIARVHIPDLEEIPDALADPAGDEQAEPLARWQLPGTEIIIARVEEGPRTGEYLFSADTVAQALRFYERARELPYLRPVPLGNVYLAYQVLTGWMIPLAWVEALPDWANTPIFGQVLWKWVALLVLFGLALGAVVAVLRWVWRRPIAASLRLYLRYLITPVTILLLVLALRFLLRDQLNVTGAAVAAADVLIELALGVAVVWLVLLTTSGMAEAAIASPRIRRDSAAASLIRLAARSSGVAVILVLVFRVAHNVGIPVYGLVAGAGVGGLAIALAARSTLENFMGTLNLYADRPVRVGDFCRYGEDPSPGWLRIGTIEEIGLRSTRIRGIDRTVTTIPNAEFANMHIVNLTKRNLMLFRTTIGLRYETTPDQFRLVLAELREMLLAHPRVTKDPARVRAIGFGPHSLDLEIFAYVNTSDWNDFLAVQEDLILRIMILVEQAGTAFAFPAQTVYHTRDPGLDRERQQAAEEQVHEWAAAQVLPFPEFSHEHRSQIMDTLDYPPAGSPAADRG